eukprot:TCONS_00055725-protein
MRVNLAVQVLSTTMADTLEYWKKPSTDELVNFIRYCDTFFDMLNVNHVYAGQMDRKPALKPMKLDDIESKERFTWLKDTFLAYFNDWEKATKKLKLPAKEQAKHCISQATLNGLRITVHSFCEMVPELLRMEGVKYFLSEKLNQDPVEEHFSKHRAKGGVENPQLEQYMMTERKMIVAKSK